MSTFHLITLQQALNWLLRSVSSPCCLHDLLWFFVAALEGKTDSPSVNPGGNPAAAVAKINSDRRRNLASE